MENLCGGGPRILDEIKFDAHVQTLSAHFTRKEMKAIGDIFQNMLAEILCEVGDETSRPSNRYVQWKAVHKRIGEDEPYESRPNLYQLEDNSEYESDAAWDAEPALSYSEDDENKRKTFAELDLTEGGSSDVDFRPPKGLVVDISSSSEDLEGEGCKRASKEF
ncbi:uncharacterized protein LOC127750719 isoform X3 [Frankliniella occidentalis]|uniref:Uncharacterized protein LOC127750719 isoform X3 n=1 Tax=Frankliniella occidentalis TaxID=133901 RepID=A0A9C6XS60_FRAOC|nr:uncharacterized protein LOC127750719 isoform X3 [Frankliniella occidentalis]